MSYQNKNYVNNTYTESISKYDPLTAEEELQLSKDVKKGGKKKDARNSQINASQFEACN